jgi:hypothetical protein
VSDIQRCQSARKIAARRRRPPAQGLRACRPSVALLISCLTLCTPPTKALSQAIGLADAEQRLLIENVEITIVNPSTDATVNSRAEDAVRRAMALFPGQRYDEERLAFTDAIARRNPDISSITNTVRPGRFGGVDLLVAVKLTTKASASPGRGTMISGNTEDLPTLYDRGGTLLRFRLDALSMFYANNNAWYGQPGPMLNGNPLAQGTPAGAGSSGWAEGFLHYGLYGMTPLGARTYLYGGLSAITSGSAGQELFTDDPRAYTAIEDAFLGIVTGNTSARGDRLVFNLSAGRQRFTLANAFLIANTAANGGNRAALQSNARWASDMLVLGQAVYNTTKIELFYVDPDELPILDTETTISGLNVEVQPTQGLTLAASYLGVPNSQQAYFGPAGNVIGGREGLALYDMRFSWQPAAPGQSGPFLGGEYARQTNSTFDMRATAGYALVGYSFADVRWTPSVSYQLSYFSGDDPDTPAYERWDPLLSGGNGEQWVQGVNHFKVVQDSNVIAHRLQAQLNLSPKVQLVPQLWAFYADTLNNIGGNPALTYLSDDAYGVEANLTAKWFVSRNLYVHAAVAYTVPGEATRAALGGDAADWFSAMAFVRYSF